MRKFAMTSAVLLLCLSPLKAQTAGGGQEPTVSPEEPAAPAEPSAPMGNPLSGLQEFSPGLEGGARSYVLPSFQYTGFADSNSYSAPGSSSWETRNTLVGSMTLQRVWRNAQLNLDYAGGVFLYNRRAGAALPSNGSLHRVSLFQSFNGRRWSLLLGDTGSYLPESSFGLGEFGGLESFGGGLGSAQLSTGGRLSTMFIPSEAILTGRARRVSNSSVAQVQYSPGRRSAFTVGGSYAILQFLEPGFFDTNYWTALTGYNRAITRRDTLAFTYTIYQIRFNGMEQSIINHTPMLAYGRRLTGRLALELSAGPLLYFVSDPLHETTSRTSWSSRDSLQYRFPRGDLRFSFSRYVIGGSGVLSGAESNIVESSLGIRVSRKAFCSIAGGHSDNRSLPAIEADQERLKYKAWYGAVTLSRELGQVASIYVNYHLQQQRSDTPLCVVGGCGTALQRHVVGLGFNWHSKPIRVD